MVGAATAAAALRVWGANDRIRLGIIGSGQRGQYLMTRANEAGGIEWVAISDIYDARRDQAEQVAKTRVDKYANYHQLLDRKDIDGVIVATFDHAHSLISIDACKAGKDVYVEKPMTSLPEQGPPLVRAVREYNRILQVGMQQRTTAHFAEAKQKYFDTGADRQGQHGPNDLEWQQRLFDARSPRHGAETCGARLGRLPCLASQNPLGPQALFQPLCLLGFLHGRADRRPVRTHGRCGPLVHEPDPSRWRPWRAEGFTFTTTDATRRTTSTSSWNTPRSST